MKNKRLLWLFLLTILVPDLFGQGAQNIKINEVLTSNTANLQDDYGDRMAWIELVNTSFSTFNVRNMFITTDRSVLDKSMSAPQRISLMCPIPAHEKMTELSGKQHLLLFLNSNPAKGINHLNAKLTAGQAGWVALYDGNGIDLIDSVSVPPLQPNTSFARTEDGSSQWVVKAAENVTPGSNNTFTVAESKSSRLKKNDPYGIGITVLSMGIVFTCLLLLYAVFRIFGSYMKRKQAEKEAEQKQRRKEKEKTVEGLKATKVAGSDSSSEVYMAVIAMAIKQYEDDTHDIESGIITIKPKHSHWNNLKQ